MRVFSMRAYEQPLFLEVTKTEGIQRFAFYGRIASLRL